MTDAPPETQVLRIAVAIYRILRETHTLDDLRFCLHQQDFKGLLSGDSPSVMEERGRGVIKALRQIERRENLTQPWEARFGPDGEYCDEQSAKLFLQYLMPRLPATWLSSRPLICGYSGFSSQEWGELETHHPSNFGGWTLHLVRSGAVEMHWQAGSACYSAGSIVILPPQLDCSYRVAEGGVEWSHDWYVFHGVDTWLQWLDWVKDLTQPAIIPEVGKMAGLLELSEHIIAQNERHEPLIGKYQENLFEQMLIRLKMQLGQMDLRTENPHLVAARRFINGHLAEDLSVDAIAAHCGISSSHIQSIFKAATGDSVMKWRDQTRMQQASNLLRGSDLSIAEVAESVGYADPNHFSRRFKTFTGQSPTRYRQAR